VARVAFSCLFGDVDFEPALGTGRSVSLLRV